MFMNKLLSLLLTLFLFSSVYAEARVIDKLKYRDGIAYAVGENEGFSGQLVTHYSNGKKEIEINYKNGKQEGLDTWWYRNGQKGRKSHYKNNKLDGLETEWLDDGSIEATINWRNGKKIGLETRFSYRANGTKVWEEKYLDDEIVERKYFRDKFAVQRDALIKKKLHKAEKERWANEYKINFSDGKVVSIIPKLPKLLQRSKQSSIFAHSIQNKDSTEEMELFSYIGQRLIGKLSNDLEHNKEVGYAYLERAAYLGDETAFIELIAKERKLLEPNKEFKLAVKQYQKNLSNEQSQIEFVSFIKKHHPSYYQLKKRLIILQQIKYQMRRLSTMGLKEKAVMEKILHNYSHSDAIAELFLMLRGYPHNLFVSPQEVVMENLEEEAHRKNATAILLLMGLYNGTLTEGSVAKNSEKVEYWARFAISENIHELRKPALKVLRALGR